MSDHSSAAVADPLLAQSWTQRHHFLLRRLHSFTGILPIGVFLIEHLFTNSAILMGKESFETDIRFIYNLPGLLMLEIFTIWLPLAFHAGLGVVYVFTAKPNAPAYPYVANWRYTLMRVSGMIALVYILLHVGTMRWGWSFGNWYTPFDHLHPVESTAAALQYSWWVPAMYVIGLAAVVFHFANGLWTFAITWGLTVSPAAQKRWGYVCFAIGIMLGLAGLGSIWKFSTIQMGPELPATQPHAASVPPAVEKALSMGGLSNAFEAISTRVNFTINSKPITYDLRVDDEATNVFWSIHPEPGTFIFTGPIMNIGAQNPPTLMWSGDSVSNTAYSYLISDPSKLLGGALRLPGEYPTDDPAPPVEVR